MKAIVIGHLSYPVIHCPESEWTTEDHVYCAQVKEDFFKAQYRLSTYGCFTEYAATAKQACERLEQALGQFLQDIKITSHGLGCIGYPVLSRRVLWNEELDREDYAPLEVIHWWRDSGKDYPYRCDIHLDDDSTIHGRGRTLHEALINLEDEWDQSTDPL